MEFRNISRRENARSVVAVDSVKLTAMHSKDNETSASAAADGFSTPASVVSSRLMSDHQTRTCLSRDCVAACICTFHTVVVVRSKAINYLHLVAVVLRDADND